MVAQTIATALGRRLPRAHALGLAGADEGLAPADADRDVVLLIDGQDPASAVPDVHSLVACCSAPVLVMTERPRDSVWGALADTGVAEVLSSQLSIEDLVELLGRARRGRQPGPSPYRDRLI